MDRAKEAVSEFMGRAGHHDTTVDESVAPGVVKEEIKPVRHEEVQEAVEREVHQDHYHTTVQPVQQQEILPEQHTHQMAPVQTKEFEHDDAARTRQTLERGAAQFQNTSTTHETQHTTSTAPRVEGEHVHHHVHEQVQPVVHKETIQPEVIHTTIPIHEVHRAEAEYHGTSVLPVKNIDDFTAGGGVLTGGAQRSHEAYEGDPKAYNPEMQLERTDADVNFPAHDGLHHHHHHEHGMGPGETGTTTSGPHRSNIANEMDPRVDSDNNRSGYGTTGAGTGMGPGVGTGVGTGVGNDTIGTGNTTSGPHRSNIANEMDPRVDSDNSRSGYGTAGAGTGMGTGVGTGVGNDTIGTGNTTSGPHRSNIANEMDPRVDSDNSRSGYDTTGAGAGIGSGRGNDTIGSGKNTIGTDFHSQDRVDPRVDATGGSSLPHGHDGAGVGAGVGAAGAATGAYEAERHHDSNPTGTGVGDTAQTTSSPHSSNLANKLDPRVDSNRDTSTQDTRDTTRGTDGENGAGNAKGADPNLVDEKDRKLTGTGAPGSHSALFGLTPDGHKETEVEYGSSKPTPAHSGEDSTAASGDGATFTGKNQDNPTSTGDTGSRAPTGSGVHEQLNDPRVAEKGHGGQATTTEETGGKPGAGSSLTGASQGTGRVGQDA